jgi:hypothetical protein
MHAMWSILKHDYLFYNKFIFEFFSSVFFSRSRRQLQNSEISADFIIVFCMFFPGTVQSGGSLDVRFSSDNTVNGTGFYASYHVYVGNASVTSSMIARQNDQGGPAQLIDDNIP